MDGDDVSSNSDIDSCPGFPDYGGYLESSEEVDIELLKKLKPIADKYNVVLLSLIAPFWGKKISPVDLATAKIRLWEELGVENAMKQIKIKLNGRKTNLFLLVESPGGSVNSSYKIASYLRDCFENITVFIPHQAASGGTLISMIGNEVVMGDMANLTPIDIQVPYGEVMVSVNRMSSALKRLTQFFATKTPDQVPYPYQALVHKMDPIIYDDWESRTYEMATYSAELLQKADYDEASVIKIVTNFVYTIYPHDFVINRNRAIEYGIKVVDRERYKDELEAMTWWLSKYVTQQLGQHYLRFVIPEEKEEVVSQNVEIKVPTQTPVASEQRNSLS